MCLTKDIDTILDRLEACRDHEEKKRILEQLDCCKACSELHAEEEASCRCEYSHIELQNLIEHIKQHAPFAKSSK